jgi:ubiquinol-cytochrome c reductase iron-sulfur subunit
VAFVVAYLLVDINDTVFGLNASNLLLGTTLGLALLLIGTGAIQWAKRLMSNQDLVEERHGATSSPEDRAAVLESLRAGNEESGFSRRSLIRNSMIGALALLGLPAVILIGDLGPLPGDSFARTVWRRGMRVVNDVTGKPLRPADIQIGQLVNAEPEVIFHPPHESEEFAQEEYEGSPVQEAKATSAVIVVRMQPEALNPYPQRAGWDVSGIVCYSKICPHVGCPISLYEQQTHLVLCPCHQSTFDLANNGVVVFGPAARSLPQLPLGVDEEGYLVAMSDFHEPVGPSYWERGTA